MNKHEKELYQNSMFFDEFKFVGLKLNVFL